MEKKAVGSFTELTPDRILNAVEAFGLRVTGRCLQLNSMENRVFEIELETESHEGNGKPAACVAKSYRPGRWTREQILEEHQFLADLQDDEFPVASPIQDTSGQTIRELQEPALFYALFPKVRGLSVDELNDGQLMQIGRLLARLHIIGSRRPVVHRLSLTADTYARANLRFLEESGSLPHEIRRPYAELVTEIADRTEELLEPHPYQRIHGDCHFGNLLWGSDGPFFVDFDDFLNGPPVQDLWLLCPGEDEQSRRSLQIVVSGYEQLRDFDRRSLRLVEPLRALRLINYSTWIAQRWSDTAFRRIFDEFGTSRYWVEQAGYLRDCLDSMQTV